MKRKFLSLLFLITMTTMLLAGCGASEESDTGSNADANVEQNTNDENQDMIVNQDTEENDVEEETSHVQTDIKEVILKDAKTGEEPYILTILQEEGTQWDQMLCQNGLTQLEAKNADGEVVRKVELHLNRYVGIEEFREEMLSADDAYGMGWSGYQFGNDWTYDFILTRDFISTSRDGEMIFAILLPNSDLITGVIYEGEHDFKVLFENGIVKCETKEKYNCKTGLTEITDATTGQVTEVNERKQRLQNLKEDESIVMLDDEANLRCYVNWNGYITTKASDKYYIDNTLRQKVCYADYYEVIIEGDMSGYMAAMKIPGDVDAQEYVKLLTEEVKKHGYKSQGAMLNKICEESEDCFIKMTLSRD